MISSDNTICVLLPGESLKILEKRIDEFKSFDVTWGGINFFSPSESIIKLIGKEFKVVYDSSTVRNAIIYELKNRIPLLSSYLDRPTNNKYICVRTGNGNNNLYELRKRIAPQFNEIYKNKIIYAEDLGINVDGFTVSIPLYIACLGRMRFKTIILFGADGGSGMGEDWMHYYKAEELKKDRDFGDYDARGDFHPCDLRGDTSNVNNHFARLMNASIGYVPEVFNCTAKSNYTAFKTMSYDETIAYLRG